MEIVITNAGIEEIINAEKNGTAPVVLSEIGLGTGQYSASATQTALKSEFKRISSIAGSNVGDNLIHITANDVSGDTYTVNEVGIYTESGTLFAVYSQNIPIVEKSTASELMLAVDILLTSANPQSVKVGATSFVFSPATTENEGVIELATTDEAISGVDNSRAITPYTFKKALDSQSNSVVHKSGAEAITGYKCFEGSVGRRDNTVDVSSVQTGNKYASFDFCDKNNVKYASVVGATYNADEVGAILATNRKINGVEYHSQIHVRLDKKGTPYATAPTPTDANDSSTKIATTKWVNDKAAKYLPLAGGKMSGAIKSLGGDALVATTDSEYIRISGGTMAEKGAEITLSGKERTSSPGAFRVKAVSNNAITQLVGNPDGTLTWGDKNIVRSINGNNADASGNVSITTVANATKATQDGNGKVIADTYLPVAGGKMTATKAMSRDVNNSFLGLHGGTGENNDGAQLYLCGSNHSSTPSAFQLHARNSNTDKVLIGNIDGSLEWDGKKVLNNSFQMPTNGGAIMLTGGTSSEGGAYFRLYGKEHTDGAGSFVVATTNGTTTNALVGKPDGSLTWAGDKVIVLVDSWKDGNGNWYRKYSDGWIEQGGETDSKSYSLSSAGGSEEAIKLNTAFTSAKYNVTLTPIIESAKTGNIALYLKGSSRTTSAFSAIVDSSDAASVSMGITWYACGY